MRRRKKKIPKEFKHSKEVEPHLTTEVRNTVPKPTEVSKKIKLGLLALLNNRTKAIPILGTFLNMEVLDFLLPLNYHEVMEAEEVGDEEQVDRIRAAKIAMHERVNKERLDNYKWAMTWISKIMPKDVGIFGQLEHSHTLAALTKRAMETPKPRNVIEMAKKDRDREFYESGVEEEVEAELAEFHPSDD